jgi:hypothetical protein
MKLFTPEHSELLEITDIAPCDEGILICGTIMGAMPMKAVLTPAELRRGLKFASFGLGLAFIRLLFRRDGKAVRP